MTRWAMVADYGDALAGLAFGRLAGQTVRTEPGQQVSAAQGGNAQPAIEHARDAIARQPSRWLIARTKTTHVHLHDVYLPADAAGRSIVVSVGNGERALSREPDVEARHRGAARCHAQRLARLVA